MGHEIDTSATCSLLEDTVEILRSRCDGTSSLERSDVSVTATERVAWALPRYTCDDDFGTEFVLEY